MERKWDFCFKLVTYSKQWIIYMFLYSRSIMIGLVFWTDFGFQPSTINRPCRGHIDILMAYPQFSSVAQSCPTICHHMDCSMAGFPVHHQYSELAQTHIHRVTDAIQPSHPLSSPSPPALTVSQHRVFSNESVLHIKWPKYWSFSFGISPSNEYSGLISFRMDWLDLLAVQGTLKSLLQHQSSKASILQFSAFFIVQLSHPYMTTGKTIALIRQPLLAK